MLEILDWEISDFDAFHNDCGCACLCCYDPETGKNDTAARGKNNKLAHKE